MIRFASYLLALVVFTASSNGFDCFYGASNGFQCFELYQPVIDHANQTQSIKSIGLESNDMATDVALITVNKIGEGLSIMGSMTGTALDFLKKGKFQNFLRGISTIAPGLSLVLVFLPSGPSAEV